MYSWENKTIITLFLNSYIYLLNSSCNWTIPKEYSVKNNSMAFLFWFNNSFPVGIYIIVLIAILILSCKVIKMYTQANRNRGIIGYCQRRREHQLKAHLAFDVVIFMICWGPSIIINITMLYNSCNHTPICISRIIFLLQAILAPSQGIIDFAVFYFNVNHWCLFLAEDDPNIMTPLLHSS
uniref:G-protein coupled receptors family 1 profile domain-containing protein n=1 Tax=Octopus bimaculoides TaxID=37653 RepID=A0A0L8G696_OCTBM|eukprot:XP_014784016.1 PREDICTED: transmembrane protein 116-like isoform X2 [Octopus bimaculoides]